MKNDLTGTGDFGISAARSDGLTVARNWIQNGWTRGISLVGGRDAVIQRNAVTTHAGQARFRFGIDLQADPAEDEFVSDALVRGNRIYGGGVGINAAGVRDSRFQNNILSQNRGNGLVVATARGVGDSRDNVVVNNTIDHYGIDGWALHVSGHTTGTIVLNNILLNGRETGGSVLLSLDSREGLVVDHNIYDNRFSTDGGATVFSLKAWRNRIGQDAHSFVATNEDVFIRPYGTNMIYGRSVAVNAGTSSHAPDSDAWGRDRVGVPDIGAVEAGYSDSFSRYGTTADGEYVGTSGSETDAEWYFPLRLTPTYFDGFDVRDVSPDSPLGPDWEFLPWHSDEDGVPDSALLWGSLTLRGGLVRSTATVTGAVETMVHAGGPDPVTTAATHVFGIGDDFGPRDGNHWAAFVTKGSANTLYAQVNIGGSLQQVELESNGYFNGIFRVEPTASGFRFYHDNVLVASLAGVFPDTVEPKILIGSHHESRELRVDYIEAGPYTSGGTYTSVVHDERVSGAWGQLVIPDAPQLHNTALFFETRTGDTANPDGSWSAWESLGADDMIQSPNGRYIQVRVTFVTTNPQRSPVFWGYQIDARPAA